MVTGLVSLEPVGDQLVAGEVADVVLPVGSGRRRFLQQLAAFVRDHDEAHGLHQLVARDDLASYRFSDPCDTAVEAIRVGMLRTAQTARQLPWWLWASAPPGPPAHRHGHVRACWSWARGRSRGGVDWGVGVRRVQAR